MSPKKTKKKSTKANLPVLAIGSGEFLLYQTDDGRTRVQVRIKDETVWLSLNQLAELFGRDKSSISKHITNVFEEGELLPDRTIAKFATVQDEGTRSVAREIEHYNLDVIISVGYRVKSHRGKQFRIWASERLREYIVKGFAMYMNDWLSKLDDFLKVSEREILTHAGKMSHEAAV